MIFIINAYPDYCPNCGEKLRASDKEQRKYQLEDFSDGACSQCKCGAAFQYVSGARIAALAALHGDAGEYWFIETAG